MPYRLVEKPLRLEPRQCLVSRRADLPMVDFGCDHIGVDPHVYIGMGVVEKAAKELCGMVPQSEVEALREQVKTYGAEVDRLTKIVTASDQIAEAEQTLKEVVSADSPHTQPGGDSDAPGPDPLDYGPTWGNLGQATPA